MSLFQEKREKNPFHTVLNLNLFSWDYISLKYPKDIDCAFVHKEQFPSS